MESNYMLISSQEDLKPLLPNALEAVRSERSLFDKIQPWLLNEQEWLEQNILPPNLIDCLESVPNDNSVKRMAAQLVAVLALARNIRELDLVLTPNGFAVVSNSNLAPASRERVDALAKDLFCQADRLIVNLIDMLRRSEAWRQSELASRFYSTLIYSPVILDRVDLRSQSYPSLWNKWLDYLPDIESIEMTIALRYLSIEQLEQLRIANLSGSISNPQRAVCSLLIGIIRTSLISGYIDYPRMESVIQFMKSHKSDFELWHASEVAKAYLEPVVFKNDRNAKGYFF
ncbi:MAG: hypothetical protein K2M31_07850 [Muribaculaceae bacterium]|nr:hypothetical protein [Muribaculaceae bacterium]